MEGSCEENVDVGTVEAQEHVFSQPPPPPPPPPRVPSTSSPAKRSTTLNSGAVIRSPMVMTSSHTYGLDGFSSGNSMPRAVEDASPLSTTTAAEYAEIEQKQLELRSVVEHRIVTLERLLQRREEELVELRLQLQKTEEDYQFNYNLIKDRDAALEEAATQLQSLYDELKRYKVDEVNTRKRLEVLEQETQQLRQRLRETEVQREQMVQRTQQTYEQKEKQLKEIFMEKERALESEKQRLHEEYLRRFKNLDDARAELSEKNDLLEVQLEKKWKQEVARLEQKISESMDAMDLMQRDKSVIETRCTETSQALSLLKLEYEGLKGRYEVLVTESKERDRNCTETSQALSLLKLEYENLKGRYDVLGVESKERDRNCTETSQALSLLKLEYENLKGRYDVLGVESKERDRNCTETSQALSLLKLEYENLKGRYDVLVTESMEKQRRYEEKLNECNAIMGQSVAAAEDGIRQQTLRVTALDAECVHLRRRVVELEWALRLVRLQWAEEAGRAEEAAAEATERGRLVGALRAEERRAAADEVRREGRRGREEAAEARRAAEDARDEVVRRTRELHETSERAQAEAARLTRELHASEAARRALEEHFHLAVQPGSGAAPALIESLRREKEALERKTIELERANAAIRDQVATFTMELQNDPAIKSAKDTQRRMNELQEELLQARDDNQRLRDILREKEEEVSRYQLEILRSRSTETAATHHREKEDRRLREEVKTAKESYERMRQALKDLQQKQQQQQHQRRHHGRHERSGKSVKRDVSRNSSSSDCSSDGTSSSSTCSNDKDVKANKRGHKKVLSSTTQKETVLLREAEMWRQKYLQLEQHVRDLLRERDVLRKELNLTKQDVDALTSEKRSLLDLNSLLKAQLRDAYRTALEYPPPTPPLPVPLPLPEGQQQQQQQQQREKVSTSHQMSSGLSANRTATKESSYSVPHLAVDNVFNSTTAPQSSAEAERISALEEELAAMKAFMVTQRQASMRTSHPSGGTTVSAKEQSTIRKLQRHHQQQQQIPSSTQTRRPTVRSGAPVVHRGSSAVRHYGYM
ncbi:uncharacterized protein TM35_000034610 [Trypanosoma theileri]|uniref:200 kDa antigen p200 n=1 Tax=Trypanosoma theileri TaxID=67003 RepID=A0A1X0P761_9TRYP|nr:uncharacterized protein TM35_000034610 [Trypanosoma theileri]ORC92708.1 hypothetical protein TM35_000034610 [Trypanosoma theileri]